MIEIGKYYKPSVLSSEDKDNIVKIDAIRCGRVDYTDITTNNYRSMLIDEFNMYYEEVKEEIT